MAYDYKVTFLLYKTFWTQTIITFLIFIFWHFHEHPPLYNGPIVIRLSFLIFFRNILKIITRLCLRYQNTWYTTENAFRNRIVPMVLYKHENYWIFSDSKDSLDWEMKRVFAYCRTSVSDQKARDCAPYKYFNGEDFVTVQLEWCQILWINLIFFLWGGKSHPWSSVYLSC